MNIFIVYLFKKCKAEIFYTEFRSDLSSGKQVRDQEEGWTLITGEKAVSPIIVAWTSTSKQSVTKCQREKNWGFFKKQKQKIEH